MWLSDNILSDSSIFSQARFARQFQIIFFLDNHVENNKILSENRDTLNVMSEELLVREPLLQHEIQSIIDGSTLPDFVKKVKRTNKERLREIEKLKSEDDTEKSGSDDTSPDLSPAT